MYVNVVTHIRTVGVGFRIAFDHAVFVAYTRNKTIRHHTYTGNGYKIEEYTMLWENTIGVPVTHIHFRSIFIINMKHPHSGNHTQA